MTHWLIATQQSTTNSSAKEHNKNHHPHLHFIPAFVLSCSFPKEPAGGEVSVTHLHPGGEAYFRCLTGYRLQGMKMLTCRNATTPYWSGKEPRCVGKSSSLLTPNTVTQQSQWRSTCAFCIVYYLFTQTLAILLWADSFAIKFQSTKSFKDTKSPYVSNRRAFD